MQLSHESLREVLFSVDVKEEPQSTFGKHDCLLLICSGASVNSSYNDQIPTY
jgi:hypothetical protein